MHQKYDEDWCSCLDTVYSTLVIWKVQFLQYSDDNSYCYKCQYNKKQTTKKL